MGSGTRLKVLESMSLGNPVVGTSIGLEGIEVTHGHDCYIADSADDFAWAVVALMASRDDFERIRINARQLVERRYDWRVIGELASNYMQGVAPNL